MIKRDKEHKGLHDIQWFGPGFGWTTQKKVFEWFDREYEKYSTGDGKLKVNASIRFGGLLRYEARLDESIDRLTSG